MTLQARKLNLIQDVLGITDPNVLTRVEGCVKEELVRAYEKNFAPMSTGQFVDMIERSREDVRAGRVVSLEDVRKEAVRW